MLTYDITEKGELPLYEYLYSLIREDILKGVLKAGDKLPSKRKMASFHGISIITVENAYEQLIVEGYIEPIEKKGYFVADIQKNYGGEQIISYTESDIDRNKHYSDKSRTKENETSGKNDIIADFTRNTSSNDLFPSTTWAKLTRQNLLDDKKTILNGSVKTGVSDLKEAIAAHLSGFRGLKINPDNIIVGAGTEYLYGLIVQLLGRNRMIAVEDPGHVKVSQVYESNGVRVLHIPVDEYGLSVEKLSTSKVAAVHISPSHHFPTGVVMPATRRHELIKWAVDNESFIIEDDYDSEFRFSGKPIPTMTSLNKDKVIYMNTFSKTLTSSIRIAYMVLPDSLKKLYDEKLFFYTCTVSSIEQYTLADFINGGYYERHISRMRNYYRGYRTKILDAIKESSLSSRIRIEEENAGLHFLISFESDKTDKELVSLLEKNGIIINSVSSFCYNEYDMFKHKLIINYSDINTEALSTALDIINRVL